MDSHGIVGGTWCMAASSQNILQLIRHNKCQEAYHLLMANPGHVSLQDLCILIIHAGDHDVEEPFRLTQLLLTMDFDGHQTLVSFRNANGISPVAYLVMTDMTDASNHHVVKMALERYPHAVHQSDNQGTTLLEAVFREWKMLTTPNHRTVDNIGGVNVDGENNTVVDDSDEQCDELESGALYGELQVSMKPHVRSKGDLPYRLRALWERIEMVLQASTCSIVPQSCPRHNNILMDVCMCRCPVPPSLVALAVQLSGSEVAKEPNCLGQVPLVAMLVSSSHWYQEEQSIQSDEEMNKVEGEGDGEDGVVAMDEENGTNGNSADNNNENILVSNIGVLLRSFPGIAMIPHQTNARLPLHVALEMGHGWKVIHALLLAFPAAISVRDPVTLLPPFSLPIMSRKVASDDAKTPKGVNVAYMLLHEGPPILTHHLSK